MFFNGLGRLCDSDRGLVRDTGSCTNRRPRSRLGISVVLLATPLGFCDDGGMPIGDAGCPTGQQPFVLRLGALTMAGCGSVGTEMASGAKAVRAD